MQSKEAVKWILEYGAVHLRNKGDHKLFRMPDGFIVSIPVGGSQRELSVGLLARIRKHLPKEGRR